MLLTFRGQNVLTSRDRERERRMQLLCLFVIRWCGMWRGNPTACTSERTLLGRRQQVLYVAPMSRPVTRLARHRHLGPKLKRFSIRVSPTDLQHIYVNSTHQSRWKCKYFTLVHSAQIVGSRVPNSRTSDLFTLRFYIYPIPPHHVRFALSDLACFALETRYATRRNPTTCTQQRRKSDSRCSDDRRKDCGYIEIYIASLITEPSRWHVSAEEQQWRSVTREELMQ